MEFLKEIRLKEARGNSGDMVMVVENLPWDLIYRKVPKLVPELNELGKNTGKVIPDVKQQVNGLLPGMERSKNGDDFIVFQRRRDDSKRALEKIMKYIDRVLPRYAETPEMVPYALEAGEPRSAPKTIDQIPRVVLPLPSPPAEPKGSVEAVAPRASSEEVDKKQMMRERMAKARAARKK